MKFLPETASEWARQNDLLHLYIEGWNLFFTVLIFLAVFVFAIRYRRRSPDERPRPILGSLPLEITWTLIPLLIALSMFAWAAKLYFDYATPPRDAMEVYVTGKQWMFYTQHPDGPREINELHVPLGKAVKLTMTSEDVIHSFYVPAFRIKRDVIPGRYTTQWFVATKPGKYRLFCAEYCGTQHSAMGGWVYVMDPAEYERWLRGGGEGTMTAQGEKLFNVLGCVGCHGQGGTGGRCPPLINLYGAQVELRGGGTVVADETYLRESILAPGVKVVVGYPNIMPSFQGQLSEAQVLQLVAYIKGLSGTTASPARQAPQPGVDLKSRFKNLRQSP